MENILRKSALGIGIIGLVTTLAACDSSKSANPTSAAITRVEPVMETIELATGRRRITRTTTPRP